MLKYTRYYALLALIITIASCKLDPLILPESVRQVFTKQTTGQSRQVPKRKIPSIPQYLACVPANYNDLPLQKWPLMINLHGMGERGDDSAEIERVKNELTRNVESNHVPAILICPQLTKVYTAWYTPDLDSLVAQVKEKYNIDDKRIIVIGYSLGAKGVWDWTMANPVQFSCAVPIAGWGEASKASVLKNLPVWAFHNKYDDFINAYSTTSIIDAIKAAGGKKTKLTLYEASGHGGWPETYNNPDVINWMLAQKKSILSY